MIPFAEELRRIEGDGVPPSTAVLTIILQADFAGAAPESLTRVQEVLRTVVGVRARGSEWPEVEEWSRILPRWFVDACGPELSREALLAWLQKWRSLAPAEQTAEEERQPWTLPNWLYYFAEGGDERQWRWLSGSTITHDRLEVALEVDGLPVAYGALKWLLRAAGAVSVRED